MNQLVSLYKRSTTGHVQEWRITVVDGGTTATILKRYGRYEGKLAVHREHITKGKNVGRKNYRSPLVQAEQQALSDWKRKRDEGSKSAKQLGWDGIEELGPFLHRALGVYNTDANGRPKPMKAHDVNWDKVTYPALMNPKLDGFRCRMFIEWDDTIMQDKVTFLSRSGKEFKTLRHIAGSIMNNLPDTERRAYILDGEIYSDTLSFQGISKAIKKVYPTTVNLKLRTFDIVSDAEQDMRQMEMLHVVKGLKSDYVTPVEAVIVNSKEEAIAKHDEWVKQGYEGGMIRNLKGKYAAGFRSWDLMKVKEFEEAEFQFDHWTFGQRREDLVAVCYTKDYKEFEAKMVGNKAEKEELFAMKRTKDRLQMTVKHWGWTDDGLPRFPIGKGFRSKSDLD